MADNPFAPPKARLSDVADEATQPLWNPNAAANWSLLFSPVFGALIHMKNWQALGESSKAASAKLWAIVSLVVLVGFGLASVLMPGNREIGGLSRTAGFVLLIGWYVASGRSQAAYMKSRFGSEYPRRGWAKPLLIAMLSLVGFVVALGVVGLLTVRSIGLE